MMWKVTYDHFDQKPVLVRSSNWRDDVDTSDWIPFEMFDDDGNRMCAGLASEEDFGPLDDYGMPNWGCTYIKFRGVIL